MKGDPVFACLLRRARLNSAGYETYKGRRGNYYGVGEQVYRYELMVEPEVSRIIQTDGAVRATDYRKAKALVRARFPMFIILFH